MASRSPQDELRYLQDAPSLSKLSLSASQPQAQSQLSYIYNCQVLVLNSGKLCRSRKRDGTFTLSYDRKVVINPTTYLDQHIECGQNDPILLLRVLSKMQHKHTSNSNK